MDEPVRTPQQGRSRASLERLLVAGIELLAERGYEGFSIADVSERSGVSIGSIYQRFDSKAALFTALQERILDRIDALQARLFEAPPEQASDRARIEFAVLRLAGHFQANEALLRVMILRGAVDETARQRGSRSSIGLARAFEAFLIAHVVQFGHESPELACDVCFRMVYASFTRRIMSGPLFESETEITWETFVTEVARAAAAYLLVSPPGV